MKKKIAWWLAAALALSGMTAWAGTFGQVVAIGGHASDLALDEGRGVLYVANFTANRIEVVSLSTGIVRTSINVPPQPGSIALSPDGHYLVVAHFGNFPAPNTNNALTVIDLTNSNAKQTFALAAPPLGVAFGMDGLALVATTTEFMLFDPALGTAQVLDTITGVTANSLPVPPANFPPQIVTASMNVSGDGLHIYGLTDTLEFSYDVNMKRLNVISYVSQPVQGPRVVSVNQDGSLYLSGWALNSASGTLMAEFPDPTGDLNIGSHAIDSARGLVYAQIPTTTTQQSTGNSTAKSPPMLQILDLDNLTVREQLNLPESLAGKSVLRSDGSVMYSVSDSGVLILPVGLLNQMNLIAATQEDVFFQANSCNRGVMSQQISITNTGGGPATAFVISSSDPGVTVSPSSGVTPATVQVNVDPNAYQNQKGTLAVTLTISSSSAINIPPPVRVLVNLHDPDQRGTIVDVPGTLVDLLADPIRNQFYVLRQDKNEVLVFDGSTYTQIGTLRTGNTPTQMAITYDQRYLLVGNDNSQIANVYDLETLQQLTPIRLPFGHYPRSIAASGNAILAACRVAGPQHMIDRIDFVSRTAVALPSLGVYENNVNINTTLIPSPNGSSIMAVEADGNVLLYDANADTFTISRKDFTSLSGAYAASSFGQYVIDNNLLNSSLVPVLQFESLTGKSSGFAFVDQSGVRTTTPATASAGVIERTDLGSGAATSPTRMVESAVLGNATFAFSRTLAPLYNRTAIVNLTVSGFTVLSWNYDASTVPPVISQVVNAADGSPAVAPGGLITILGQNLSPISISTSEIPLPSALGESCLAVNGAALPVLFVSPTKVNAQLPFQAVGNVTLTLRTPGGVSDNYYLTILLGAPSVFRSGTAGDLTGLATVVRAANNQLATLSNPIHPNDSIVIYLTGLGQTTPAIAAGVPAPSNPLSVAVTTPQVSLGGVALPLQYSGLTPGQIGVYQINAVVPKSVPTGIAEPLVISQSGSSTSLNVRVVE